MSTPRTDGTEFIKLPLLNQEICRTVRCKAMDQRTKHNLSYLYAKTRILWISTGTVTYVSRCIPTINSQ